ncbi:MAG: alpha/beta hydrolase [Crocinitomicaceae bacterium]|nr:alpha/beta hydrolase [Crocinitomicaceae bacterium]
MKPDLLILHGAIGASSQFDRLANLLDEYYTIHRFNFEGHGGRATDQPYSIELFSQNLIDYTEEHSLGNPFVFGYSMGGYVTLHAISQGLRVKKLMTLGTKFNWTPEGAQHEVKLLNPSVIEEKIPKFAAYQESLHSPLDWKIVMQETADMMVRLGNSPVLTSELLNTVQTEVLCCVGLKDSMVTLEETIATVDQLPNGSLHTFEEFEHPIEKVDLEQLCSSIRETLPN